MVPVDVKHHIYLLRPDEGFIHQRRLENCIILLMVALVFGRPQVTMSD